MISDVRAYARARMTALGYAEWKDGAFSEIPKTKLDSAFHLETGETVGVKNNQDSLEMESPITIRFFKAPTLRPGSLMDDLIGEADLVISDFMKASNRTTQTGIKNVDFENAAFGPLNNDNDNGLIAKLAFKCMVIVSTR